MIKIAYHIAKSVAPNNMRKNSRQTYNIKCSKIPTLSAENKTWL